jgi:hypothetical protein
VVNVSPDLEQTVLVVAGNTMLTDSPIAVYTEYIAFVLFQCGVLRAGDEEFLCQQRVQPRWLLR